MSGIELGTEAQIIGAVFLDSILGDPAWFPHPVRLIGYCVERCEQFFRSKVHDERRAGAATWIVIVSGFTGLTMALQLLIGIFPLVRFVISAFILYTMFAFRDLVTHGRRVMKALERNDIGSARSALGLMVSRETGTLNEEEIISAAVESLSENFSDSVVAPLLYALVFGPAGAVFFRCVNTMDAMCGYKNDKYRNFGRFIARADDAASYIPARISGIIICAAAFFFHGSTVRARTIMRRDHAKTDSPNSGYPEAAAAGALGVRIGGPACYFGEKK